LKEAGLNTEFCWMLDACTLRLRIK